MRGGPGYALLWAMDHSISLERDVMMKRRALLGSTLGFLVTAGCASLPPTATVIPSPATAPTATSRPVATAAPVAATATPGIVATPAVASPRDVLYVRDDYGVRGPGQMAVVDVAANRAVRSLPLGLVNRDWSALYTTTWSGGQTALKAIDSGDGKAIHQATIDGVYDAVGVSPGGTWLGLQREVSRDEAAAYEKAGRWRSGFKILDRALGGAKDVDLDGNFWFDAVSDDGTSLYLIENLPPILPYQYRVRLYDLSRGALQEGAIADKTGTEIMSGSRTASHVAPDGSWLYSLYLNQAKGPFIHALNLTQRYAECIFLPPDGKEDYEKLMLWSTALSSDGRTLYAANGALGLAATIDLTRLQVTRTAKFPVPSAASPSVAARLSSWLLPVAEAKRLLLGGAALSPDGAILYAIGDHGLFAINTTNPGRAGYFAQDWVLDSVAVDPSGERLYVVDAERATILAIDPQGGKILATTDGATHPAGILRVTSG